MWRKEAFTEKKKKGAFARKAGDRLRAFHSTRAETVHGVDVRVALVETLGGGLGPELCSLIRDCAEQRQNRLSSREYDDTTWAARTWHSFTVQKLSVAIQRAMALEIAHALGLSTGADPRAGM